MGGDAARARTHFDRAVELSKGKSASAYVAMAASVAQPARNHEEFDQLLEKALAIESRRGARYPSGDAHRPETCAHPAGGIDELFTAAGDASPAAPRLAVSPPVPAPRSPSVRRFRRKNV